MVPMPISSTWAAITDAGRAVRGRRAITVSRPARVWVPVIGSTSSSLQKRLRPGQETISHRPRSNSAAWTVRSPFDSSKDLRQRQPVFGRLGLGQGRA